MSQWRPRAWHFQCSERPGMPNPHAAPKFPGSVFAIDSASSCLMLSWFSNYSGDPTIGPPLLRKLSCPLANTTEKATFLSCRRSTPHDPGADSGGNQDRYDPRVHFALTGLRGHFSQNRRATRFSRAWNSRERCLPMRVSSQTFTLQASADLSRWADSVTTKSAEATLIFQDRAAGLARRQFYRLKLIR